MEYMNITKKLFQYTIFSNTYYMICKYMNIPRDWQFIRN